MVTNNLTAYDPSNVFGRIIRGEIPSMKLRETNYTLAIQDIAPQARIHALVFPKGAYMCFEDFTDNATPEEIVDFFNIVRQVAKDLGVNESGYRIISNKGPHAQQEVPHFHFHILGGENLGPLLDKRKPVS